MSFCAMDAGCTVYDPVQRLAGYSGNQPVCQGCRDTIRAEINLLRYDYIDLSQLIVPADVRNELGKIFRPKPESKPPLNLAPFLLRGQIAYAVMVVVVVLRRHLGLPPIRDYTQPVREGYGLDNDVRWLMERVDDLARLPATAAYWSPECETPSDKSGLELISYLSGLHRRARRLCGTDPRTITVPGNCPQCNTTSLRRNDDNTEKIWCLHCKLHLSAAEYGHVVRLQIPVPRNPAE